VALLAPFDAVRYLLLLGLIVSAQLYCALSLSKRTTRFPSPWHGKVAACRTKKISVHQAKPHPRDPQSQSYRSG
jgi:hypothetical protein